MTSTTAYIAIGMLAGFLFLINKPDKKLEAFRELRFPMRSEPKLVSLNGEQVVSDPDGVLIDQGSQAIRVGSSALQFYTNSIEQSRITNSGKLLIGESQDITPINGAQSDRLTVKGGIVLTGGKVLESQPSTLSAYFYDQLLGDYYDYGGLRIMDRSYDPGNSSSFLGEWIQLHVSSPVILKYISMCFASQNPERGGVSLPNIVHILGSINGEVWYIVASKLNQASQFRGGDYITYELEAAKSYFYYRIVFTQMYADTVQIANNSINRLLGPYLQLYGLTFTDTNGVNLPALQTNRQKIGNTTYTLNTSITTGNVISFLNNSIQSFESSLIGCTQNQIGTSINPSNYTVITFPYYNDYYLPADNLWSSSGLSTTQALIVTTPFNSAVALYTSYHGSTPIECMRIVHNGSTGMVGIGMSQPRSNLSVLGSFDTSYMSCDVSGTKLAVNRTSANYIHLTSGISNSTGFSQILFHSSDGSGQLVNNNYYDTSIISYGGSEQQNNRGTLAINADMVQLGGALHVYQGNVGVGTQRPGSMFSVAGAMDAVQATIGTLRTSSVQVSRYSNHANYISFSSGISSGKGMSQLEFYSSDATGVSNAPMSSRIISLGDEMILSAPRLTIQPPVKIADRITIRYEGVGVGTTQPSSAFHVDSPLGFTHSSSGITLQTMIANQKGVIGTITNNDLVLMTNKESRLYLTTQGKLGLGTTNPLEVSHVVGNQFLQNGSLILGTDNLNQCLRLSNSTRQGFIDYGSSLLIRSNRTTDLLAAPSYYTTMSITDTVGIGTTIPGRLSKGNTKSYGLDIYGYSDNASNLLRLVNTNDSSLTRGTAIDFATTTNNETIVNAKIVGRNYNTKGILQFFVKTALSNVDANDLENTGGVEMNGLVSGSDTMSIISIFTVKNIYGSAFLAIDRNNYMSESSVNGDTVLKTESNNSNLLLQSGSGLPGIFISAKSKGSNPNNKQSRIGIGTTNPPGLLSINRVSQIIPSNPTDVSSLIDPYILYANAETITATSYKGNQTYKAPSIYLASGGIRLDDSNYAYGARMEITGGGKSSGTVTHGTIDFYTTLNSGVPSVSIGNPTYNTASPQTYFGLNMNYLATSSINIASYAIYARGAIVTTSTFISTSDQRIKKNISIMDSRKALDMVNCLEICEYDMRDSIKDPGRKVGVIAQQVREVIPEAVSMGEDQYIANVMGFVQKVYHDQGECIVHLFDAVLLEEGDRVKLVGDKGTVIFTIISKKITDRVYAVKDILDMTERWMIYGTLEKGILAVDKPMLGMLALSAIKQITQELVDVKSEVSELKAEMAELRKMLMELKR